METILKGINNIGIYIDDILIGGCSLVDCRETLFLVLSRLNDHNIKINLEKCKFFVSEIEWLGHVVSFEGIKPSPNKEKAILESPEPTCLKELQSYLGLLNYYCRFLPADLMC